MEEILQNVWEVLLPVFGGLSVGGVVTAILVSIIKGAFSKVVSKLNIEQVEEEAVERGIEKIKSISFKQSIQPLVESELEKVNEKALKVVDKSLGDVETKLNNLLSCMEKFYAYFDNAIGVPEEKKEELKKALENAKNGTTLNEEQEIGINTTETPIVENKGIVGENKGTSVER